MPEGLLWFDDSDRTVRQKAAQAVARFRRKGRSALRLYAGARPAIIYVNPADLATLGKGPHKAAGIEIKPQRETLRHHYFVVGEEYGRSVATPQQGGAATWLVACLGLILFLAATACVLAYCWMW